MSESKGESPVESERLKATWKEATLPIDRATQAFQHFFARDPDPDKPDAWWISGYATALTTRVDLMPPPAQPPVRLVSAVELLQAPQGALTPVWQQAIVEAGQAFRRSFGRAPEAEAVDGGWLAGYAQALANARECPYCHANDRTAPCAYPNEGKPGCLRDRRLAAQAQDGCRYPMSYGQRCEVYPHCECGQEVQPPWVLSRSMNPGDDPYWRTEAGRQWLVNVFLPFYDRLGDKEQADYCNRWSAPAPWISLFLHPELDESAAAADLADFGTAAKPLNYRKIWGAPAATIKWREGLPYIDGVLASYEELVALLRPGT